MRPGRGFTQPKRNRGRLSVSILNSNLSLLYSKHTPRSISQLKDIALQTLDRKVFIHRSDHKFAGLEHDCVVSCIRNRATRCDRSESRASATAQSLIHGVVMQISRAPPTLRRESFREHAHDRIKLFTFQVAIGICASDSTEKIVFSTLFGGNCSNNLLCQNVQRLFGNLQTVELTTTNRIDNRRTFNQLIARKRKDSALWETSNR